MECTNEKSSIAVREYQRINVDPYNDQWPLYYRQESELLRAQLGDLLLRSYHIGSTAIVGMPFSKPVIDLVIEVDNLDVLSSITSLLQKQGYGPLSRSIIPHRSYITSKLSKGFRFNCHIFERADPQIIRYVRFRDYLSEHSEERNQYAALKQKLAVAYSQDINGYVQGKSDLIRSIDAKAKRWSKQNYSTKINPGSSEHWSKQKLIMTSQANLNVFMTHFQQYLPDILFIRIPGYTLVNLGLKCAIYNYAIDSEFGTDEKIIDKKILDIHSYFSNPAVPFTFWVAESESSVLVKYCMKQRGFYHSDTKITLYLNLDSWEVCIHSDRMEVRKIQSIELSDYDGWDQSVIEYLRLILSIYTADDPIEFYALCYKGKAMACVALVFYAQIVGLYRLYGSDEHGAQLENNLLNYVKNQGYHRIVTIVSEFDQTAYLTQGFQPLYSSQLFSSNELP